MKRLAIPWLDALGRVTRQSFPVLAGFVGIVGKRRHRFAVLRTPEGVTLTDARSGRRFSQLMQSRGSPAKYRSWGRAMLRGVIRRHGVRRVNSALDRVASIADRVTP